jgi:hypothetical protein
MNTPVVQIEYLATEQESIGDVCLDGKLFTGIAFEVRPTAGSVTGVLGYRYGKRHGAARRGARVDS